MHFCSKCENMYYIKISEQNQDSLVYYCKKCGNEDKNVSEDNMCVLNTNFKKKDTKYKHIINKYTKFDPTLPRAKNMKCPNEKCASNSKDISKKENSEIIYMRYDNTNIKYVYLCSVCDSTWTS